MVQRGLDPEVAGGDLVAWSLADLYYTRLVWIGALVALAIALGRRPKPAVILLLWSLFTFLLTNPHLLHLPGTGLMSNFTLVIGAYMPIAFALGWVGSEVGQLLTGTVTGRLFVLALLCPLLVYGMHQQLQVVDPAFQMVTAADVNAMNWVDQHIAEDARFLVNGFLAFSDRVVVGSDAGWWLPYYTRRATMMPPITYGTELLTPGLDRQQLRQLLIDIRASNGDAVQLERILCQAKISHLYLGDRQGQVGFGATALIPPIWLTQNASFQLLHQDNQAQVWGFERKRCATP
jgi:hypothetical protein